MDKFNAIEIDLVIRGLFALQKLQPSESEAIQQLINKMANTVYQVEEKDWVSLTDEEILRLYKEHAKYQEEGMKLSGWGKFAADVQTKLREKNT